MKKSNSPRIVYFKIQVKDRIFSAIFGKIVFFSCKRSYILSNLRKDRNLFANDRWRFAFDRKLFAHDRMLFANDFIFFVKIVYFKSWSYTLLLNHKVPSKDIFRVETRFWFRRNSLISNEFKKSIFSYLKRFEITDKSFECKNVTKPQKYYILIIFLEIWYH